MKTNGIVLWRGPSLLDSAPIVVVAIGIAGGSKNSKTGDMLQTYVLRADMSPLAAIATGADVSICGKCPHRGRMAAAVQEALGTELPTHADGAHIERTCYVNVAQGPTMVYKTLRLSKYINVGHGEYQTIADVGRNRVVRLGTYGDPAAVPAWVWRALVSECVAHTGYTHQWRTSPELRDLCMASADTVADAREASGNGWRSFWVAMPLDMKKPHNEVICPASAEAGKKLTCAECRACGGANGRKSSIVIQAHGGAAVMSNVYKRVA